MEVSQTAGWGPVAVLLHPLIRNPVEQMTPSEKVVPSFSVSVDHPLSGGPCSTRMM